MNASDTERIRRCLVFLAESDHLEHEHGSRLGMSLPELRDLLRRWSTIDLSCNEATRVVVHNAFNELVNGLALREEEWTALGTTRAELSTLWSSLRAPNEM